MPDNQSETSCAGWRAGASSYIGSGPPAGKCLEPSCCSSHGKSSRGRSFSTIHDEQTCFCRGWKS